MIVVLYNSHSNSDCGIVILVAGGVLLFVTRKLDSEQVAANLQIQGYSGE